MVQIITRILIFMTIIALAIFMIMTSFVFGVKEIHSDIKDTQRKVEVFKAKILKTDSQTYTLEKDKTDESSLSLNSNELLYVDFGRLSTAMFISESKTIESNILSIS